MNYDIIDSKEKLEALYGQPAEISVKKEMTQLDQYSKAYLKLSPFAIVSTSNEYGMQDCSPRGDYPGFIKAISDTEIAIPDRPGNNRTDSLSNIIANPGIGILILIPGFDDCLRINGLAKIVTNPELLEQFEYKGKLPKTVVVVDVKEVYLHCAKAITRAKLWSEESKINRSVLPTLGKMLMTQIDPSKPEEDIQALDAHIADRVKNTLY